MPIDMGFGHSDGECVRESDRLWAGVKEATRSERPGPTSRAAAGPPPPRGRVLPARENDPARHSTADTTIERGAARRRSSSTCAMGYADIIRGQHGAAVAEQREGDPPPRSADPRQRTAAAARQHKPPRRGAGPSAAAAVSARGDRRGRRSVPAIQCGAAGEAAGSGRGQRHDHGKQSPRAHAGPTRTP